MKRLFNTLLIMLTSISISACASGMIPDSHAPYETSSMKEDTIAYDEAADAPENDGASYGLPATEDRKIERYFYYSIDTVDFDTDSKAIDSLVVKYEGYTESSALSKDKPYNSDHERRTYSITIKVPVDKSEKFKAELDQVGEVKSTNNYINDLTQNYTDINIRLESKKTELDKLNELVETADNIEDVMAIQSRILDVQAEIDQIEAGKRDIDKRVAYDTYEVYMSEVFSYNDLANRGPAFSSRIVEAFRDSIQIFINFIQDVIIALITIWPLLIIAAIVIYLLNRNRKKKIKIKDDLDSENFD